MVSPNDSTTKVSLLLRAHAFMLAALPSVNFCARHDSNSEKYLFCPAIFYAASRHVSARGGQEILSGVPSEESMPFSLRKLSKLNLLALCIVALLGIATFGFGFRDWFSRPAPAALTPIAQVKGAAAEISVPIVQELLTLRPTGFDPAELTIPSGNFQLSVDNLTGISTINLALAEEKKNKLKDIKIESRNRDWREEFDLKTGVYILSETSNPRWTCRITVTDKVRGK